ncbi:hypothetical protein [Plantactinospora sp. KLBMP9567]|uniref:hypothetical protein n=1 Tax=Plantactinospora sp. KLBMP9567 TaxID=3085900 RepID=UPI002982379A|nr:hypothetical protein [Plantactinospora sp. KLBMP9567]MDW5327624.1 hypothetical protein [Plantactinospora sp. KLBMP9567]
MADRVDVDAPPSLRNLSGALGRYLRARRTLSVLAAAIIVAVAGALWGNTMIELPAANAAGSVSFPLSAVLPAPFGALVALSLHSEMATFDAAAARRLWRLELCQVVIGGLVASLLLRISLIASATPSSVVVPAQRNVWFWAGVALVSARLFGRQLCWVLPLALMGPLEPFGVTLEGAVRWWAWPLHDGGSVAAGVATAGVFGIGLALSLNTRLRR